MALTAEQKAQADAASGILSIWQLIMTLIGLFINSGITIPQIVAVITDLVAFVQAIVNKGDWETAGTKLLNDILALFKIGPVTVKQAA